MQFADGDEIIGPNSYMRINGAWVKFAGSGSDSISDAMVRYYLSLRVPEVRTGVSKTTRETTTPAKEKAYYVYKGA